MRRLAVMPFLLLGLATITFAISPGCSPADPLMTVVETATLNNPDIVAAAKAHWGLDQSQSRTST